MATTALHCPRLFDGTRLHEQVRLLIGDGRVEALETGVAPRAGDRCLPPGSVTVPGLIDLQVNGGGGRLFNDDPSVETVAAIADAHRRCGTTSLLPTLITDTRETVRRAVGAVREAVARLPGVLGIHLEGPFLNVERRGIHRREHVAQFAGDGASFGGDLALLTALGGAGRTLVTLAPECVPDGTVRALAGRGAIVFAGHTAANFEQMRAALADGVAGFTHVFNAMSPLTAREPGAVGAALLARDRWAGLVLDGHHVAAGSVDVLRAARGLDRVLLVSDAMPPAGTDARMFTLQGQTIRVEGGRCVDAEGRLAGAAITLADAVRIAIAGYGFTAEQALGCATRGPAEALGRADLGVLRAGAHADAVVFDAGWRPAGVLQRGAWVVAPEATS